MELHEKMPVKRWISGSIALAFMAVFFSGTMVNAPGALAALDFNNVIGTFGRMGILNDPAYGTMAASFRGIGGTGVADAFLFVLQLVPFAVFALGFIKVVEFLGATDVAARLLSPVLKPLMGIPGIAGVTLIASWQALDGAAGLTRILADNNAINKREAIIFSQFQFTAGGPLTNFFGSGVALFAFLGDTAIGLPLIMLFVFKVVAANMMRLYLWKFYKEETVVVTKEAV